MNYPSVEHIGPCVFASMHIYITYVCICACMHDNQLWAVIMVVIKNLTNTCVVLTIQTTII